MPNLQTTRAADGLDMSMFHAPIHTPVGGVKREGLRRLRLRVMSFSSSVTENDGPSIQRGAWNLAKRPNSPNRCEFVASAAPSRLSLSLFLMASPNILDYEGHSAVADPAARWTARGELDLLYKEEACRVHLGACG